MEILLEVNGSKKELIVVAETAADTIKENLPSQDVLLLPFDQSVAIRPGEARKPTYVLQKWSEKWKEYVDVNDFAEIISGDKLSASVKRQSALETAQQQCRGLMQPSKANKDYLKSLFPQSTSVRPNPSRTFDPSARIVIEAQKQKKKKGITRDRPRKLTAMLLPHLISTVPKSSARKKLSKSGRIKKIQLRRSMSCLQAKNELVKAFSQFQLNQLTFLSCAQSNEMYVCDNHSPTGDDLISIAGQGSLYLCEEPMDADSVEVTTNDSSNVSIAVGEDAESLGVASRIVTTSASSGIAVAIGYTATASVDVTSPSPTCKVTSKVEESRSETLVRRANEAIKSLRESLHDDSDSNSDEDPVITSVEGAVHYTSSDDDDVHDKARNVVKRVDSLVEWRRLHAEQDAEYQQSLRADRAKEQHRTDIETISMLRRKMKEEYMSREAGNVQLAFRGRSVHTICSFQDSTTLKDLYGYVYACVSVDPPFSLYQCYPRKEVPISSETVAEFGICSGEVLVIESCNRSDFNPLILFSSHLPLISAAVKVVVSESPEQQNDILKQELERRTTFCTDNSFVRGQHSVRRSHIYEDIRKIYAQDEVLSQCPFRVYFKSEKGVDTGGLVRDALSAFWEEAYKLHFDGSSLLVPMLHPGSDMTSLPALGRIISHGYITCGNLPIRLPFPCVCAILLGSSLDIPDDILFDNFLEYLPEVDRTVIQKCIQMKVLSPASEAQLISVLSRFGCLEKPTLSNLLRLCAQVARHEFLVKPLAALHAISSGIPSQHYTFWSTFSVVTLHKLYLSLTVSPAKVIQQVEEPFFESRNEERVFNFLITFIGSMNRNEAQRFLRFTTGSSVCSSEKIRILFNSLSGFTRRPIAHTCSSSLQLSISYNTYTEFAEEFSSVLSTPECWRMNAI